MFLAYHVSGRMMISREPKVSEARQQGATWNEKKRTSPCLWHFDSSLIFYPLLTWWAKDMVVPPALGVLRQSLKSVLHCYWYHLHPAFEERDHFAFAAGLNLQIDKMTRKRIVAFEHQQTPYHNIVDA
jgi:hypothetical protein